VTCADNGQSVIEISKSKDFDLILIARELPTIDGLATTKIFRQREARRKRKRRTPVIVFTDMLTQDDLRLYQDIGMDGCIPKPVDRKSLLDTITQAVPKHYAGPPLSPRTKVKMKQPGIDHSAITVTSRHAKTLVDLHNANETNSPIVGIDKNLKKKSSSPRRTKTTAMSTFERTRRAERKKKKGTETKDIESGTYTHNPDTELAYSVLKFGDCPKDVPLFHFVVIHDFFDSMETMRIFFKPLVRKFQGLRVLVFNLPGQAYTKWSRKQLLNNKFYAEVLQGLLQHVDGMLFDVVA
jgi:CheY-like chemotaxis protein